MANEQIKDLVRRVYESINRGDLTVIEGLLADDYVEHGQLPPGTPPGREGVIQYFTSLYQSFPDLHYEIEDIAVEGDKAWTLYTMTGTHTGDFRGLPPTGRGFEIQGLDIARFKQNMLVEHWGLADRLGLREQLGVMKAVGIPSARAQTTE